MAIYAVISQPSTNAQKLPGAIEAAYPGRHRKISNEVWLVADAGEAKVVSDKLGVSNGDNGAAVVIEASTYYGRAGTDIWAWIKANWELGAVG